MAAATNSRTATCVSPAAMAPRQPSINRSMVSVRMPQVFALARERSGRLHRALHIKGGQCGAELPDRKRSLDLQRGCEQSVVRRKVFGEEREGLHSLVLLEPRGAVPDLALDERMHALIGRRIAELQLVLLRPALQRLRIEDDQGHSVGLVVSVHEG